MKGKGEHHQSMKRKAHKKARYERIYKGEKEKLGVSKEDDCFIISLSQNMKDRALEGTIMDEVPRTT